MPEDSKTLHEIDRAILAEKPNHEVVTGAFKSLFNLLACPSCALTALRPVEEQAVIHWASDGQELQTLTIDAQQSPRDYADIRAAIAQLTHGGTLPGHRLPRIVADRLIGAEPSNRIPGALITTPISQQDCTVGFLSVRFSEVVEPSPEQFESIHEISHSLAIALQYGQMREDLRKRMAWMEHSLREKEILLREIHHRVKNNLQVVSSLLNLQTQATPDPVVQSVLLESQMRVRSMALIHEKLYQSETLSHIQLSAYVQSLAMHLFRSYQQNDGRIQLRLEGESFEIGVDNAVPIGLILNELISNSLKYAFPDGRSGEILVATKREGKDKVLFRYRDNGVGLSADSKLEIPTTLGMRLIEGLAQQIGVEIEFVRDNGVQFSLRLPLDTVA